MQSIRDELKKLWDVPHTKLREADYVLNQLVSPTTNRVNTMNSLALRRMRTLCALGSKIKTSKTLKTESETFQEFLKTQEEPILGRYYVGKLRTSFKNYFANLDLLALRDEMNSPKRRKVITAGASYPSAIAPLYPENYSLLLGSIAGLDIFKLDFDHRIYYKGEGDCKVTFVPKNYKTKRMIALTNRDVMDKQKFIAGKLRDYITKQSFTKSHIIQFDDQTVQHSFLKEGYASIDLSSASDRVYKKLIKLVWPEFFEVFGDLLPDTMLTPNGKVKELSCIGTQGYPLTFVIMSIVCGLLVSAVKRSVKPSANYGDDIIVPEIDTEEIQIALYGIGLRVNSSKTYASSSGFIESCGVDARVFEGKVENITPIHLRGVSDVEVVEFFNQLVGNGLIATHDAIQILKRRKCNFFSYEWEYAVTPFHLHHGERAINTPRMTWDSSLQYDVIRVPDLKQEVDRIRGLGKKESDFVLNLLKINEDEKHYEYNLKNRYGVSNSDEAQASELYHIKKLIESTQMALLSALCLDKKLSFKAVCMYLFITTELRHYDLSVNEVKFNERKKLRLTDSIDEAMGIRPKTVYPIYRYRMVPTTKLVIAPVQRVMERPKPAVPVRHVEFGMQDL